MAITAGVPSATPADTGTQLGPDVSVTPDAGIVSGDLVLLATIIKSATVSPINITTTGGQTWTQIVNFTDGSSIVVAIWWCQFNGTWSADPNVNWGASPGTDPMSVVMYPFHPTTAGLTWAVDVLRKTGSFAAPSSGTDPVAIPGITTVHNSTVAFALWATGDDNNWSSLSDTGWTRAGSEEYRNTSGTGHCITFAHRIQTTSEFTNDVQQTQGAINRDAGIYMICSFSEGNPSIVLQGGTLLGGTIGA